MENQKSQPTELDMLPDQEAEETTVCRACGDLFRAGLAGPDNLCETCEENAATRSRRRIIRQLDQEQAELLEQRKKIDAKLHGLELELRRRRAGLRSFLESKEGALMLQHDDSRDPVRVECFECGEPFMGAAAGENRCGSCRAPNEEQMEELLHMALDAYADAHEDENAGGNDDAIWHHQIDVCTFKGAGIGIMTRNAGLVVKIGGAEFRITIVRSR